MRRTRPSGSSSCSVMCLLMLVTSLETRGLDAQFVAVLGILVSINATLRLVPGIAGFSAVFFLPILCGYVFGRGFWISGRRTLTCRLGAPHRRRRSHGCRFKCLPPDGTAWSRGWLPKFPNQMPLQIAILAAWGSGQRTGFGSHHESVVLALFGRAKRQRP